MIPDKLIEDLTTELATSLNLLHKAKKPEDKLLYSQVVKNLCESMGVFFSAANDLMMFDDEMFDE